MKIKLIAAVNLIGVIGNNGTIPWKCSLEQRLFKSLTLDSFVVMGRKTYESLPKPLVDRVAVVISYKEVLGHALGFKTPDEVLDHLKNTANNVFIIGGESVYRYFLKNDLVDELYISYMKNSNPGDTYFPLELINNGKFQMLDPVNFGEFSFCKYLKR